VARINLAEAKARLSELVDRAEKGEEIEIARRGRPAVRLVPVEAPPKPRRPIDIERLRKNLEGMPMQSVGGGEFIRMMRDSDRY
jgi:prevent-host-death family protein